MTITIDSVWMMMIEVMTLMMTDSVDEMKSKGSCSLMRMMMRRSYSSSRSAEGQMGFCNLDDNHKTRR